MSKKKEDLKEEDKEKECKHENCECKHSEYNHEECAHENCECQGHENLETKANEYLDMAKRIQADFENFRRRSQETIENARVDGQVSVIEVFLPCLDTFKSAKKMINDKKILEGINMIEENIKNNLTSLGVEEIPAIGETFNPHLHNVVAVVNCSDKENDIITEQFEVGYKFKDKVIRYSKVVVNKKEDI